MKYGIVMITIVLGVSLCYAQVPSYVPREGLVGWWPFNGNANDESGNGNHGIVTGAALAMDMHGTPNRAYYFDGTNAHITVPNHYSISPKVITISGWINANKEPSNYLDGAGSIVSKWFFKVDCGDSSDTYAVQLSKIEGKSVILGATILNNMPNSGLTSGNNVSTIGKWLHFVYVHDSTGQKLFVDGRLISKNSISGVLCETLNPLIIGADSYRGKMWRHFSGVIDDIGIWRRALSDNEVRRLYESKDCAISVNNDSILGYRKVETHQVVTYALRNNPSLSYKWIATGGYMLGASKNHYCDVIWGYDKYGSVCCIVSDSTCSDTVCVSTTINNAATGGIAGEVSDVPTMSVRANTANNSIDISTAYGEDLAHFELMNVDGLVVLRVEGVQTRIGVSHIAPGVYHVVQRDAFGNIIGMQRVVVDR